MADRLVIYKDSAERWRWRRVAPNGEIIADSGQGYLSKRDVLIGANRVNASPYTIIELHPDPPAEGEPQPESE